MAIFKFLKKRRQEELTLPPPPKPPEIATIMKGDIEPIRSQNEQFNQIPEIPPMNEIPTNNLYEQQHFENQEYKEFEMPEIQKEEKQMPEFEYPMKPQMPQFNKQIMTPIMQQEKVYDKTIKEETEQTPEKIRKIPKPTYVCVEDYKKIINDTNTIRSKLMDAENFVKKLNEIKTDEEKAFEKWTNQIENVEKKLNYVEQIIAKAGE